MAVPLGAVVVAGYSFGEDQDDLPKEVFKGADGGLDRVSKGEEAIWFNSKNAEDALLSLFA